MRSSPTLGNLTRRDVLKGLVGLSVGTATGAGAHGYLYERHRVDLTKTVVPVAGFPEVLAGFRIGFMTDLHRSASVPHELVESAVSRLMAERPDLILLGGDYVTWRDPRFVAPAVDAVRGLSAPHGVFGVLGNHDDERDIPAAMASKGIEILKDERTRLTLRGEALDLIGIRYWTTRGRDLAGVARGAAKTSILLAHNPSRLRDAAELSLPLMLSGHTHGGQIVLPGFGAVAARNFPIVAGIGTRGRTTAFVSRGVGTVFVPVRINCPPEVAVLTLQSAGEA